MVTLLRKNAQPSLKGNTRREQENLYNHKENNIYVMYLHQFVFCHYSVTVFFSGVFEEVETQHIGWIHADQL